MKKLFLILFLYSCGGSSTPALRLSLESPKAGFIPPISTYKEIGKVTPKNLVLSDRRFPQSLYLNPLAILDNTKGLASKSTTKILSPNMYRSFDEAGINDKRYTTFLLCPGDYSSWGVLSPRRSGKNIVVRAYDVNNVLPYDLIHPCKQENKVILAGFRMENVSGWILHGLTFDHSNNRIYESKNITIDFCYILNSTQFGIRVVNSENIQIQNNVMEQTELDLLKDGGGIAASATKGRLSTCNIVNNEGINFPDWCGTPRESSFNTGLSSMTGNVILNIENNDVYINEKMYLYRNGEVFSRAENFCDIKNGSGRIVSNRVWGYRASDNQYVSGSSGTAIVFHRNAQGWIFKDNTIFNSTTGVTIASNDRKFPAEKVLNIALINNIISVGKLDNSLVSGVPILLGNGGTITNNSVTGVKPFYVLNDNQKSVFKCNSFNPAGDYTFHIKRWTGVEVVTIKGVSNKICTESWN